MNNAKFYSKIILFGEYGIINNSKGLLIPYNAYHGKLCKSDNLSPEQMNSNSTIRDFSLYLESLQDKQPSLAQFNINELHQDLNQGLYFSSTIPVGYGVGSSGALVAAIYDNYSENKITVLEPLTREKLLSLKKIFSAMETFFHGQSSGLDPLNSYLSHPIVINSQDDIQLTGIPSQQPDGRGAIFIIDSGIVSETVPMITIFMENLKSKGFRNMMKESFTIYTNLCVENFISGDFKKLLKATKNLSINLLQHFKPMIPDNFLAAWKDGIDSNQYYLKLCGSGGGGYILGFTEDWDKTKMILKNYKPERIYQF